MDLDHRAGSGQSDSAEPCFFDAVLLPHRSLEARGFLLMMAVIIAVSFAAGLFFTSLGAWPIGGFFGLDVGLIWLAFRANYKAAASYERVRLTDRDLTIEQAPAGRRPCLHRVEPAWVRVEMDDPPDHDSELSVSSHGRRLVFGRFLSPDERLALALALRRALDQRRQGLPGS